MKKKIYGVSLLMAPLFILGTSITAHAATTSPVVALSNLAGVSLQTYGGLGISSMPQQASNVNFNQPDNTNLDISNASVQGSSLNLSASIVKGKTTTPIELTGSLFTSPTNDDIYGNITDSTGKYNVVRFEFVKNPSTDFVFNRSNANGPMLVITLQKAGTRDFSFFQVPLNAIFDDTGISNLFDNYSNLPVNQHYSDADWMTSEFTPSTTSAKTSPVEENTQSTAMVNNLTIQPNTSSTPYYWTQSYSTTYSGGAQGTITDTIKLGFNVQVPTGWGAGTWTNETLSVASTSYHESATGTTLTNFTNWEIGKSTGSSNPPDPFGIGVGVDCESPAYFMGAQAHGVVSHSGTVEAQLGYGISFDGFGVTFTYTPGGETTLGGPALYPTGSTPKHWAQMTTGGNGNVWLDTTGQQYTGSFEVGHLSGQSASAFNEYFFDYDLWNWNTGDHGMKSQSWVFDTTD